MTCPDCGAPLTTITASLGTTPGRLRVMVDVVHPAPVCAAFAACPLTVTLSAPDA